MSRRAWGNLRPHLLSIIVVGAFTIIIYVSRVVSREPGLHFSINCSASFNVQAQLCWQLPGQYRPVDEHPARTVTNLSDQQFVCFYFNICFDVSLINS